MHIQQHAHSIHAHASTPLYEVTTLEWKDASSAVPSLHIQAQQPLCNALMLYMLCNTTYDN
jgi:hypothetical protein